MKLSRVVPRIADSDRAAPRVTASGSMQGGEYRLFTLAARREVVARPRKSTAMH